MELRSAVIAAAVAAVVAAPLSNAATDQVTIAVKKVVGPRGHTGKRGPTGPAGPPGLAQLTQSTTETPAVIKPGETGTAVARCPAGQRVIWGGFNAGAGRDVRSLASEISYAGGVYLVTARNFGSSTTAVSATALCATYQLVRGYGPVLGP
ncbi:MAG: hypothetical protein ACRDKI_04040 [Solirubrobacterales bacterium]